MNEHYYDFVFLSNKSSWKIAKLQLLYVLCEKLSWIDSIEYNSAIAVNDSWVLSIFIILIFSNLNWIFNNNVVYKWI